MGSSVLCLKGHSLIGLYCIEFIIAYYYLFLTLLYESIKTLFFLVNPLKTNKLDKSWTTTEKYINLIMFTKNLWMFF